MRLSTSRHGNASLLPSILFTTLVAARGNLDCGKIIADEVSWDLSELGGPRSVMNSHHTPPTWHNTTYTIDICQPLKPPSSVKKGDKCPGGTRICAIEHTIKEDDNSDEITEVIPIAGELSDYNGGSLDAKVTRLKKEDSQEDDAREGLEIELRGGVYGDDNRKQKAIIDFLCEAGRTGLETDLDPPDNYESQDAKVDEIGSASLQFVSYQVEGDIKTLRLKWYTKHACEESTGDDNGSKSKHWGFFMWLVIIVFLATAAYLIFGSWLNYNRYGARGWDLLPHSDSIRDAPYLFKDWARRVVNTVQGSGSRGGYSAV